MRTRKRRRSPGAEESRRARRRRGIFLLPNLFTTACLFAGFYAIIAALNQRFEEAAIAILVAIGMDGLDGRIARLTRTQSDFGADYDSLADMVSFGVAPALALYSWGLTGLGKIGWLAAFFYTAATALRLARFNNQVGIVNKRYFQGLASPAAAGMVAGLVWLGESYGWGMAAAKGVACALAVMASALMVSNIRYHSFKDLDLKGRIRFITVLVVVLIFVLISLNPPQVLFAMFSLYALSGPVLTLISLRKRRLSRKAQGPIRDDLE